VALTEPHVKQMLQTGFISWKLLEELADVGRFHGFTLSDTIQIGITIPYVNGIYP
jgi:hypothetical protein